MMQIEKPAFWITFRYNFCVSEDNMKGKYLQDEMVEDLCKV
jgi:hypothetical protein